jgi:predicted nucleic acid-binding Zn finger protein
VRILVEPFGIEVACPRSSHDALTAGEIRVWGRRRLLVLERLIPVAREFRVVLLGSGMPSFWIADCGDLSFTLGLSVWTANDWAANANFDLLAPRATVDGSTAGRVMDALRTRWLATPDQLAAELALDRGTVESALVAFAQAGGTMYDLVNGVWRLRELSRDPLDLDSLRWANDREKEAAELVARKGLRVEARSADGKVVLTGRVGKETPTATLDADRRLVPGQCTCSWFFQNKLRKGPCAHLLAIRLAFERRLGELVEAPIAQVPAPAVAPEDPPDDVVEIAARRKFEPRVVRRDAAATQVVVSDEAERFLDLLVELTARAALRASFVAELASVLRMRANANAKATALFRLLERHKAVEEFFVLEDEQLAGLLEEWG